MKKLGGGRTPNARPTKTCWTEVLGSERLTGATLDRLTHRCHILETRGESYRLKDAKRRRKPKQNDNQDDNKQDDNKQEDN